MDVPVAILFGLCMGVVSSMALAVLVLNPMSRNEQFKKDCVAMAHGHVDKSAKTICVKDGKILFHE